MSRKIAILFLSLYLFAAYSTTEVEARAAAITLTARAHNTAKNPHHWQISLNFGAGFDVPAFTTADFDNARFNRAKDPANYRIVDFSTGRPIDVVYVEIEKPTVANELPSTAVLFLDPSVRLRSDHLYHIYVTGLTYGGKPAAPPPQAAIQLPPVAAVASRPEGRPESRDAVLGEESIAATAAESREDANLYISGEVSGARGTTFLKSIDLKFEYPFRKVIGRRVHSFKPFFELKSASGPKADPDAMKFGLNWEFPAWRYRGENLKVPIRRIVTRVAPQFEADKDFDNVNFTVDNRFRLLSRTYAAKRSTVYFRPFVGQEVGANLKSPLPGAEGQFIYRALIGTTLHAVFPIGKPALDSISFEGDYTRRWLLRSEVGLDSDDDGNPQLLVLGKGPRDYLDTSFNLNFTKALALTISYEYGRLPPLFKLVDSKTTIGLTYKIKFKPKDIP